MDDINGTTPTRLAFTVTESWLGGDVAVWQVRVNRRLVAKVACEKSRGMIDSDELRDALASRYGVRRQAVQFDRKRTDRSRIVPRAGYIDLPDGVPATLRAGNGFELDSEHGGVFRVSLHRGGVLVDRRHDLTEDRVAQVMREMRQAHRDAELAAMRCNHTSGKPGCDKRGCPGQPPWPIVLDRDVVHIGAEATPTETGAATIGRMIADGLRRLTGVEVTGLTCGNNGWADIRPNARKIGGWRMQAAGLDVTVVSHEVAYDGRHIPIPQVTVYIGDGVILGDAQRSARPKAEWTGEVARMVAPHVERASDAAALAQPAPKDGWRLKCPPVGYLVRHATGLATVVEPRVDGAVLVVNDSQGREHYADRDAGGWWTVFPPEPKAMLPRAQIRPGVKFHASALYECPVCHHAVPMQSLSRNLAPHEGCDFAGGEGLWLWQAPPLWPAMLRVEAGEYVNRSFETASWWDRHKLVPGDYPLRLVTLQGKEVSTPEYAYAVSGRVRTVLVESYRENRLFSAVSADHTRPNTPSSVAVSIRPYVCHEGVKVLDGHATIVPAEPEAATEPEAVPEATMTEAKAPPVPEPAVEAAPAAEATPPAQPKPAGMKPRRETYKGRKLLVRKRPRHWGYLEVSVNGQVVSMPIGSTPEQMDAQIRQLRGEIDFVDRWNIVEPGRYPDHWFKGAPKPTTEEIASAHAWHKEEQKLKAQLAEPAPAEPQPSPSGPTYDLDRLPPMMRGRIVKHLDRQPVRHDGEVTSFREVYSRAVGKYKQCTQVAGKTVTDYRFSLDEQGIRFLSVPKSVWTVARFGDADQPVEPTATQPSGEAAPTTEAPWQEPITEWVMWGRNDAYVPEPIKLTGGSLRHCEARKREREAEGGWGETLLILPKGQPYPAEQATVTAAPTPEQEPQRELATAGAPTGGRHDPWASELDL
ncbi:hypothetical protein KBX50_08285 [Micromonospora sp. C51]|uniref:hypothetical protein n=1 Tax=Micromonospora sp. C51 TaxID=2824879 RepID=UPI001B3664D9|nr:hypothetical protein [Micromonospora sp. C51]MBQ1048462.1 hypothetical protein [Micromonospora sp. C51]